MFCCPIARQQGVAVHILRELEPTLFPELDEGSDEPWHKGMHVDLLCMALRALRETSLPTVTHQVADTVQHLTAALKQHYVAIGEPLKDKTPEQLQMGYYVPGVTDKRLTCILDAKTLKTVLDFSYAEELRVLNPLRVDTHIVLTMHGREVKIDNIMQEFETQGIFYPQVDVKWSGSLFAAAVAQATPKRKSPAQAEASPPPSGPSSATLSSALRRRLNEKASNSAKDSGSA